MGTVDSQVTPSVLIPDVDATAEAQPSDATAAPDLSKTSAAIESPRSRSIASTVIVVLAILYTLYFAREFLLPITFALLLNFLLSPVVRALTRLRIPTSLGAGVVMLVLLGILATGLYGLSGSVEGWAVSVPRTLTTAQAKFGKLIRPLARATKTAEQVATAASGANSVVGVKPREVIVQEPGLLVRIFGMTQRSVANVLEVVILLYFLLASGDLFLQKLIKVLPNLGDKRKAVSIARETEASISAYLLTTTLVNVAEGVLVTVAMYLWKMPDPILWGAAVVVLEFIPYLGALVMVVILSVTALAVFGDIGHVLLIPASFLLINIIQSNVVSPIFLGHRLALNPVAIFVGLAFWFWIWGIPGAFIAVPLLATFKIFCDHIEMLASVGEFLGRRDEREQRSPTNPIPNQLTL
jgi:predicted PurR-regulated permease PerM